MIFTTVVVEVALARSVSNTMAGLCRLRRITISMLQFGRINGIQEKYLTGSY